jgi:hypothetical protein
MRLCSSLAILKEVIDRITRRDLRNQIVFRSVADDYAHGHFRRDEKWHSGYWARHTIIPDTGARKLGEIRRHGKAADSRGA